MSADINPHAIDVVRELNSRGLTVATCESLTAGLTSATIADVPGASAVLRGGLITYATPLKAALAGVSEETIARHGVVSAQTAQEMAAGARRACASDWAVALTGVAGPDPQEDKPAGTVFIGLAGPSSTWAFRAEITERDRAGIRHQAVDAALSALVTAVRSQS